MVNNPSDTYLVQQYLTMDDVKPIPNKIGYWRIRRCVWCQTPFMRDENPRLSKVRQTCSHRCADPYSLFVARCMAYAKQGTAYIIHPNQPIRLPWPAHRTYDKSKTRAHLAERMEYHRRKAAQCAAKLKALE